MLKEMCQFACSCPRFRLGLPWEKGALAATRVSILACVLIWEFLYFVSYLLRPVYACVSAFRSWVCVYLLLCLFR